MDYSHKYLILWKRGKRLKEWNCLVEDVWRKHMVICHDLMKSWPFPPSPIDCFPHPWPSIPLTVQSNKYTISLITSVYYRIACIDFLHIINRPTITNPVYAPHSVCVVVELSPNIFENQKKKMNVREKGSHSLSVMYSIRYTNTTDYIVHAHIWRLVLLCRTSLASELCCRVLRCFW